MIQPFMTWCKQEHLDLSARLFIQLYASYPMYWSMGFWQHTKNSFNRVLKFFKTTFMDNILVIKL